MTTPTAPKANASKTISDIASPETGLIGTKTTSERRCEQVSDGMLALHLCNQLLEGVHVPAVISGFIDRRFSDESRLLQARMVDQTPERLQADGAFANVLMPIKLRSTRSFGVVAVPYRNVFESDGGVEFVQRVTKAGFGNY